MQCRHPGCYRHAGQRRFPNNYRRKLHERTRHDDCRSSCVMCKKYPHTGIATNTSNRRPRKQSAMNNTEKLAAQQREQKKKKKKTNAVRTQKRKSVVTSKKRRYTSNKKRRFTASSKKRKSTASSKKTKSTASSKKKRSTASSKLTKQTMPQTLTTSQTQACNTPPTSSFIFTYIKYYRQRLLKIGKELESSGSPLMSPNNFHNFIDSVCPGFFEQKLLQLAPHMAYSSATNFSNLDFANHYSIETPILVPRRCPHPTTDTFQKCLHYKVIETLHLLSFQQVVRMVSVCRSQIMADLNAMKRTWNSELKAITLFAWAKGISKTICKWLYMAGLTVSNPTLVRERHERAKKAKDRNWKDALKKAIDQKTFLVFKVDNFTHILQANLFSSQHGSYKLQECITCACKVAVVPFSIPVREQSRHRTVEIRNFDDFINEKQLLEFLQVSCTREKRRKYQLRASDVNPIIAKEGSSCGRLKNLIPLEAFNLSTNQAKDYHTLLDKILKRIEKAMKDYTINNVIAMCVDVQCYEFIEKLLAMLSRNHRFQVIFPTNDFFHVVKQYATSVFKNYHKLFFVSFSTF